MSGEQERRPRPISECENVEGLLEQIRLRPSMWTRPGCLRDVQNVLIGYAAALSVHHIDESDAPFPLSPSGPFAEWLRVREGWSMSCGWADAIQQHSAETQKDPVMVFFELWDAYRGAALGERPSTGR